MLFSSDHNWRFDGMMKKGKPIAPISKLMGHIGWDVIWLLMATFPVAAAMRSTDCGIMDTISQFIMPLLAT